MRYNCVGVNLVHIIAIVVFATVDEILIPFMRDIVSATSRNIPFTIATNRMILLQQYR